MSQLKIITTDKEKNAEYLEFLSKGKASANGLILGDRAIFKATLDETTGFLTAPVNLSRTGVQEYYGFELGLEDRALDTIGVLRSPDEVFNDDSINSFTNLVITDDHPDGFVTTDNVKDLQVGTVSGISKLGETLVGVATITDKDQIKKMKDGKLEVSVGYSNELKEKSGVLDGVKYEFVQTNIRANHLAIVDAGRCGRMCKITIDKGRIKPVKITIDGIDFDVENDQLAQAINNQQKSFDAEKKAMQKKVDEAEEEKEEIKKDKDKAEATADALKKSTLDDDAINVLVSDRASLISKASLILGDKMPECTDCPKEIKGAVIDKVLDMGDLSGKSIDYIDAAYDMAVKQYDKASKGVKKLEDDFLTDKDGNEITRDSARDGYIDKTVHKD